MEGSRMKGHQFPLRTPLVSLALCALLAGCAGEDSAAAVDDDECAGNPLAQVLPNKPEIASKPMVWRSCRPAQVSACYSREPDCARAPDRCLITLHDAAYGVRPDVADGGSISTHDHAQSMILAMSKMNVEMVAGTRESMLQFPEMLAQIGGPDYLPVADTLPTGDTYVITLPGGRRNPRRGELHSVIADRYALTIECGETLQNATHARRVYEPFLSELDFAKLP